MADRLPMPAPVKGRSAGRCWLLTAFVGLLALAVQGPVFAQAAGSLPLVVGSGPSGNSYSVPIQTLLFFTALSFLPAVLLMMTGFTRIVIVLSLLRQALGTQSAPPNQVIIGLSLFLTFFVMGPTLDRVYQEAYVPYTNNTITFEQALDKAEAPMRGFMLKQTRQSDFALFSRLARLDPDLQCTVVEAGIYIANGPAIAPDARWMLHTDSFLNTVYRYTLDALGNITDKSVWRVFSEDEGTPDGMTLDSEGRVWIAFWGGACIRCFTPDAECLQTIAIPASQVTSISFGGADLQTMLVTTARVGLGDAELAQYPLSGSVFTLRTGATGVLPLAFG